MQSLLFDGKNLLSLGVLLLIVIWIISRQIRPQVVKLRPTAYIIFMVIGIVEFSAALKGVKGVQLHLTMTTLLLLLIGSMISPIVFGGLRGWTYKFWWAMTDWSFAADRS